MYEIPWFKTETTIFSNRKIQIILKLPEGDTYFRVWIQLIALAVECNNRGRLEIGENNPMTIQNFSKIMGKSNKKIEKILKKFLELEMLKKEGETFLIKNWDKYQSIEKYEKYQMQNRERQRKYREKHKSENEKSNVITMLDNEEEKNTKDIENKKLFYDSKTILQEIVQGEHLEMEYELLKEEGPDHNKSFTVAVNINGERLTTATGRTKKKAEQSAAYQAILKLHKS